MSTKLLLCVEPTLRSFYIFNSNLCRKEGEEHKKILYYFPDDIEINTKIKDVGLVEALLGFTGTFTEPIEGCKSLHTQKTTQLFYQPEPGFWLVIAVNKAKEVRTKDGIEITEYRAADGHDEVYRNLLKQFYDFFHLLEGPFESLLKTTNEDEGQNLLRQKLKIYFDQHLNSLVFPINQAIGIAQTTEYLILNKLLFLRPHNIANMLITSFPIISDVLIYYNHHVLCTKKTNYKDLFCLHGYITDFLQKSKTTDEDRDDKRKGVYIMGNVIADELKTQDIQKAPTLYLHDRDGNLSTYFLIIYSTLNLSVCLLIETKDEDLENKAKEEFYMDVHKIIEPYGPSLSNDIKEMLCKREEEKLSNTNKSLLLPATSSSSASTLTSIFSKSGTFDTADAITPKFLFINDLNMKHISNITTDNYFYHHKPSEKTDSLPLTIMNTLADLLSQPKKPFNFEEVIVKTTNEYWIAANYANNRQFYVIVQNNKATLLDVSLEMKRIFDLHLPYDVLFDIK